MRFNDYPYVNILRKLWRQYKLALQKSLISYEDIEQEAYVILLTKMNKCHSKSPVGRASYFKKILLSRIKDLIKEKKQEKDKPHLTEALDLEIYKNKLTEEEFDILRKYFDLGLTLKEIAEEKKISIYKVWFIKERAKKEIMPYELTHWETIEIWKKRRKAYLRTWRKLHPNYYRHWRMQKKIALNIY